LAGSPRLRPGTSCYAPWVAFLIDQRLRATGSTSPAAHLEETARTPAKSISARDARLDVVEAALRVGLRPQSDPSRAEGTVAVVDDPLTVVRDADAIASHFHRQVMPNSVRHETVGSGDLSAVVVAHGV